MNTSRKLDLDLVTPSSNNDGSDSNTLPQSFLLTAKFEITVVGVIGFISCDRS